MDSLVKRNSGGNATIEQVLNGKTFTNNKGQQIGTMPDRGGINKTLSFGESIAIPEGYHNGNGKIDAQSPSGAKSITSNGAHDVTAYATANVNVPAPTLYVKCGFHNMPYNDGPSTVLDLGSVRTVKAYAFGGCSWNGGSCKIQYSSNGSSWTLLDQGIMPSQKTQGNSATFSKGGSTNIAARYWRCITGEGDSNGSVGWVAVTYI